MSIVATRQRRTPEAVREEALTIARRLLIEQGPGSITLKAVAGELGMTHANLLHHFGSAAGLQSALIGDMARGITATVERAVAALRSGEASPRDIVDIVFDAFETGGAGRLFAWLALSGDTSHLEPIHRAIRDLVAALEVQAPGDPATAHRRVALLTLAVIMPGLGSALVGSELASVLDLPPDASRRLAAGHLAMLIDGAEPARSE